MAEHRIDLSALARSKAGGAHSIYGASGSHMYLACAGSLIPNIMAPNLGNPDSAYGTVAHGVTQEWLDTGRRPTHLIGKPVFVDDDEFGHLIWIDEEMLGYAEQCVDRCEWMPGEHLVEYRVDFSHLTPIPGQGGTLDFAAMQPRRVYVDDHKFGATPENTVYAEENPQLMLYAVGLMRDPQFEHYGFEDFIIRVHQPRLDHFDEWHTTRRRLVEFEDYARERMHAAWHLDAPRTPGPKQCRFCKVRATCSAQARLQEELTALVFTDATQTADEMQEFKERLDRGEAFKLDFRAIGELNTEQMARLLPYRAAAEAWWKALESELQKRAMQGDMPSTMKIVEGRSKRRFRNETEAERHLMSLGIPFDDLYTTKMVSPNQAEGMLRKRGYAAKKAKELLQGVAYKPPGRATLVPLSDRRDEVQDISKLAFEDESTHETEEDL